MRVIYEWGALLSTGSAIGWLIFWGVSLSGVLSSPTTGFDVFLTPGDRRYIVSEHGAIWAGSNLKRPVEAERLKKRAPRETIAQWKGPGFLVFITDQVWLVGGSMLIPMFASTIVAAICFVAHRQVSRKRRAMPKESPIATPPTTSKQRWLQFCIRAMPVVVGTLCLGLSWWVIAAERQRRAATAIEKLGGSVHYVQNYNRAMGVPLALLRGWLPPAYSCEVGFVRLNNSRVTDAELVHLQKLTGLRTLYLYNTQVTDAGLAYVHGLTDLQRLGLSNTQVTDTGLAELREALPKCQITGP